METFPSMCGELDIMGERGSKKAARNEQDRGHKSHRDKGRDQYTSWFQKRKKGGRSQSGFM